MVGLIGQKVGMTQVFDGFGNLTPVTMIKISPNMVVEQRTQERNGYNATLLGVGDIRPKLLAKPVLGQFESRQLAPKRHLFEFRDFEKPAKQGEVLDISLFTDIESVDITGYTKGRGFQGTIKRHGFHGGRKTHGSKFHRTAGSTGMAAYPARVIKGTKMAGRMGNRRATVKNLLVVRVDLEQSLLLIGGAVPGTAGRWLIVSGARRRK